MLPKCSSTIGWEFITSITVIFFRHLLFVYNLSRGEKTIIQCRVLYLNPLHNLKFLFIRVPLTPWSTHTSFSTPPTTFLTTREPVPIFQSRKRTVFNSMSPTRKTTTALENINRYKTFRPMNMPTILYLLQQIRNARWPTTDLFCVRCRWEIRPLICTR